MASNSAVITRVHCTVKRIGFNLDFKNTLHPFLTRNPFGGIYANSADPVQIAASDQYLQCLVTEISVQITIKMKAWTKNPSLTLEMDLSDKDGQSH